MTASMDESGVNARIGDSCLRECMRSRFKAITFAQGAFRRLQFSAHQIPNSLTELNFLSGKEARVSVLSQSIALRGEKVNSQNSFWRIRK
jgi:hypothetical protein